MASGNIDSDYEVSELPVTISSSVGSDSSIRAFKYKTIIIVTGYINVTSELPLRTSIATIGNYTAKSDIFQTSLGSQNSITRLFINSTGGVSNEKITSVGWYSFTFVAPL